MNTDVIADMLTRMRNALKAGHFDVKCPYSKFKENILEVLKEKQFIKEFTVIKEWKFKEFKIEFLAWKKILNIIKISKPGQRIYLWGKDIKTVMNWYWISVVSTSEWVMAWYEAYKKGIWWELMFEIY